MKNKTKTELVEIISSTNDDDVRRKAKMYLRRLMQSWSQSELERSLKNDISAEKEQAEWVLWRRKLNTSFENLASIIEKSKDEDKTLEAITIMGEQQLHESLDFLIDLISTTEENWIRETAAWSLKELNSPKARKPLIEQLKIHPECAESLIYALAAFDCRCILELLVEMFIDKPKAALLRINIRDCIKNQDLENILESVCSNCLLKLDFAMQDVSDRKDLEQLEELYEILQRV